MSWKTSKRLDQKKKRETEMKKKAYDGAGEL